jgi:hypothetical protein
MEEQYICTSCGYVGYPKRLTKGSFWLELFLWLIFVFPVLVYISLLSTGFVIETFPWIFALPGLLYSIWRLTSRYDACPKCKNASTIPLDTPIGQELLLKQQRLPEHHS